MSKSDWTKKPEPDPGRVIRPNVTGSMSDYDIQRFQSKIKNQRLKTSSVKGQHNRIRISFSEAIGNTNIQRLSISRRIEIIRKSGKQDCDEFIHETAMKILNHAMEHGDASAALRLFKAMPNGNRRERLSNWFRKFSPISIGPKRATVRFVPKDSRNYQEFDTSSAKQYPFFKT